MFTTISGIILKTYPFRDNKIIAKIYTENLGLISCVVKKTKSQSILSELLTMAEVTYKNPKAQSLVYVKEARVEYVYKSLTTSGEKIQCSIILCEILTKCINGVNEELYNFIISSFKSLDNATSVPCGFSSFFLVKLCKVMGIEPLKGDIKKTETMVLNMNDGCFVECAPLNNKNIFVPQKESCEIYKLSCLDFDDLSSYNISDQLNISVFNYLISYISIHLADLTKLKSIKIFEELV